MPQFFILLISALTLVSAQAGAQDMAADLILPPALEAPDAPFYRGARVKLGETMMPVIEDRLPEGVVAEYQPRRNAVVVNSDANISENRKGQALLDVVSDMSSVFSMETAAGPKE